MKQTDKLLLGKKTEYKKKYTASILQPLKRHEKTKNNTVMYGYDIWNAYDFMWVNQSNNPQSSILTLSIPCESEYIIESKSMKLYLGAFYNKKYEKLERLIETIKNDIEEKIKHTIQVTIADINQPFKSKPLKNSLCLDESENNLKEEKKKNEYSVHTHCFRSLCPVTGQPDFASIYLCYKGAYIKKEDLTKYLFSFQEKSGFHESCIEEIYNYILKSYNLSSLSIHGYFNRRGGIDINPIRYTNKNRNINFARQLRQ